MGLFRDDTPMVTREQFEDMRHQRDQALSRAAIADDRLAELVKELMAVKRHDLGMLPHGFEPQPDPLASAPKTELAVDEFAAGDAELANRLRNTAIHLLAVAVAEGSDPKEADHAVAAMIRRGDT